MLNFSRSRFFLVQYILSSFRSLKYIKLVYFEDFEDILLITLHRKDKYTNNFENSFDSYYII